MTNPLRGRVRLCAAVGVGLALAPLIAAAQRRSGMPRIGVLSFFAEPTATRPDPGAAAMLQGLRELGYIEGKNVRVEWRFADGRPDRLAELAAELVRIGVDVIVAGGPPPREAATRATRTIPIVTVSGSDPVREGWAASLSHPGGNVTGLTVTFPELDSKRLELLKQMFPEVVRVAVMIHPTEVLDARQVIGDMQVSSRRLGLQLQVLEVFTPDDIEPALAMAKRQQAQALYAIATNTVLGQGARIATLATNQHLLSVSELSLMARAGFFMTYGADLDDLVRRAVALVDKILKGARPGDLPIERPTKFQLTINLGVARAAGIVVPQALLLRADEVIQ